MSEQVIPDPIEFARGRKSLEGNIALQSLPRLEGSLATMEGSVHFKVSGFVNELGAPGLRCEVQGKVKLLCQRCLEPMEYSLDLDSKLLLDDTEPTLEDYENPDAPETIPIEANMSVAALVEDEILLGLPMAPHHAGNACKEPPTTETGKPHPFAVLERLKTVKND